jgi:hypothetical protein
MAKPSIRNNDSATTTRLLAVMNLALCGIEETP